MDTIKKRITYWKIITEKINLMMVEKNGKDAIDIKVDL